MTIKESNRQRFESLGVEQVRLMINAHLFVPETMVEAVTWLAQREAEERARSESASALLAAAASRSAAAEERAATAAERQARAAEKANTRATIAIIIAVTSAIIGIVNWFTTHPVP